MRTKIFFNLTTLLLSMTFVLSACSKDSNLSPAPVPEPTPAPAPTPTPEPKPTYSINGVWIEDLSADGYIGFGIYEYKENGSLSLYEVNVDKVNRSIYEYDGNYIIDGSNLTEWHNHPVLGRIQYEYEIKSLNYYDFTYYSEEFKTTVYYHRVVDTYNMIVGEDRPISVDDSDFVPLSYMSNHNRVASVDGTGLITAKEIGTAYISVSSSRGTAVIRVVVSDPENMFCDFTKYLNVNIDNIPVTFGNEFIDVDRSKYFDENTYDFRFARHYNLYDDFFINVDFFYDEPGGKVKAVSPAFKENVNTDEITNYLKSRFEYLETHKNGTLVFGEGIIYLNNDNGRLVFEEKNIFAFWSPNDKIIYYIIEDVPSVANNELMYYDMFSLLNKDVSLITDYFGENFSDSFKGSGDSDGLARMMVTRGFRHYPNNRIMEGGHYNDSFNGYEGTYEYIVFEFPASGIYGGVITKGEIDCVKLKFLNDLDISDVFDKLKGFLDYEGETKEEDGSSTWHFVNKEDSYIAEWNPTWRILVYKNV